MREELEAMMAQIGTNLREEPKLTEADLDAVCSLADDLRCKIVVQGLTPDIVRAGRNVYVCAKRALPASFAELFANCARLSDYRKNQFIDASVAVQNCIISARRSAKQWENL